MTGKGWLHSGLTQVQATARLAEDGPNLLPSSKPRPWLGLLLDVLSEPMLLLLGAGGIYLLLGDLGERLSLALEQLVGVPAHVQRGHRQVVDRIAC